MFMRKSIAGNSSLYWCTDCYLHILGCKHNYEIDISSDPTGWGIAHYRAYCHMAMFSKNLSLGVFLVPFYVQKWHKKFEKSRSTFS